jgi:hypothetical protein
MACTLASVFSLCAQPGGSRDGALLGALRDRLDRDRMDRMLSDEVMELRRRRLKPTVQPVEMNDLYNRRKGSFDAHKEYVVVDLTSFNDGDERVFSPLTSTTAGSSPPRTLEREYAL